MVWGKGYGRSLSFRINFLVPTRWRSIWAGRGLQPCPQRFIETAAKLQRSETGCKPVPAQMASMPLTIWAGRGLQPCPQRFIETAAKLQRSETGCKPVPAQH